MKWFYRLGIGFYQKIISPRKGYRCAHSLEHGGPGCSGAVLQILEEHGLMRGYNLISQRFADCSDSAEQRRKREEKRRKKEKCCGGSRDDGKCMPDGWALLECGDCIPRMPKMPHGDCVPDCSPSCDLGCDGGLRYLFKARR
ncbi:membrane protein insertion efficiency factor YidD [Pseudomonas sp. CFBP 13719]|uniref:membrane protein insertion efficiency factor YidD n=1 Tax=Pseudomonas sp. CFBP 13719 TaxID=2775303 RepID=UPI001786D234|nr:membrane protein insertion efficiency factor YidD [Pseudomonas putida]MBD8681389.1 membrane protein insertion efficiency factor YidD [Pseudomonas sp. CFBP 13719]